MTNMMKIGSTVKSSLDSKLSAFYQHGQKKFSKKRFALRLGAATIIAAAGIYATGNLNKIEEPIQFVPESENFTLEDFKYYVTPNHEEIQSPADKINGAEDAYNETRFLSDTPNNSNKIEEPIQFLPESENFTLEDFKYYVTPNHETIQSLVDKINGVQGAYKLATQWVYVSEQKLNNMEDKWLTPHEFLTNTPNYPSNPLKGEIVSDCEEQVNTLASLIRAEGVKPEEVRVGIGIVKFNGVKEGHSWIELMRDGNWLVLDPSSGPYWDDKNEKLVEMEGMPFNHYATHKYPIVKVWAYYNDIYQLDLVNNSGNAPASWNKATLAK